MSFRLTRISPRFFIVFSLTAILLGAAAFQSKLPRTSSDVQTLFPRESLLLDAYERANELYGNFIHDVIVIQVGPSLSLDAREQIFNLEDELSELDGVVEVVSPLSAFSEKVVSPLPLRNRRDGTARFFVKINGQLPDDERASLNNDINAILARYLDLKTARTGAFFISESVAQVIDRETKRRIPWTLLVLLLVTSLILKNLRKGFVVLLAPGLSVIWTVVGASLFDLPLGPISQLVPPFILAVGASYSVHVATRIASKSLLRRSEVLREMRYAIGIAAFTTIIGLSSLFFMDIKAVEEFSLLASIGVAFAAFFSLFLTPTLLPVEVEKRDSEERTFRNPERKGWAVALICLVTLGAGYAIPKISVHTDPMMFLPVASWERMQIDQASAAFPGNRMLSIVFEKGGEPLSENDFTLISKLSSDLLTNDYIYSVVFDGSFAAVGKLKSEFSLDLSGDNVSYAPESITRADGTASRMIIETSLEGAELLALAKEVTSLIRDSLSSDSSIQKLTFELSGLELLIAEQTTHIVRGIIRSLFFTLCIVSIILLLIFRDIRLVLIGLVPNVIPVTVVLGAIGWIYQDINLGASLVGAAALSIAVDNTFHFMISWKETLQSKSEFSRTAVEQTMGHCFPSFITTSLVLTAGFLTMAISEVLPVQQFGLLLSITLTIGLLADTIVLPYLVSRHETRSKKRKLPI